MFTLQVSGSYIQAWQATCTAIYASPCKRHASLSIAHGLPLACCRGRAGKFLSSGKGQPMDVEQVAICGLHGVLFQYIPRRLHQRCVKQAA